VPFQEVLGRRLAHVAAAPKCVPHLTRSYNKKAGPENWDGIRCLDWRQLSEIQALRNCRTVLDEDEDESLLFMTSIPLDNCLHESLLFMTVDCTGQVIARIIIIHDSLTSLVN
jgi:hypothetical protein